MNIILTLAVSTLCFSSISYAQQFNPGRADDPVPREMDTMYVKGLKYLKNSQDDKGAWSSGDAYGSYPGTVSLCLLAFLAHGDDPNHGPYANNIKKCINYLIERQQANGYIGSSSKNDPRGNMYNHGFSTLALAEAYGMVDDKRLGKALEKAVALTVSAQKRNSKGAWRYTPESQDADSTLAGCMIVSLYAARNAGIKVPEEAMTKALKYMDTCRSNTNGSYGYTSASGGRPTLAAIGSLCFSLAKQKDSEAYKQTLIYLNETIGHREINYPYYWEYYMSQALFHADEELWNEWNKKNIRFLRTLQQPDGSLTGRKGKAFSTSASLLSLALNYRFLPIYEK